MSTLSELVVEVAALAHQLRKTDFRLQQKEGLLAPGRAVLQVLAEEGPRTVPWIAAKQNASRQNVQIIANRFADQGFVEFKTNPAHKKSDLVQITEKGRQALATSQHREGTILERLAEIDETQVHSALELLRRMRHELGGRPAETKTDPAANGHP